MFQLLLFDYLYISNNFRFFFQNNFNINCISISIIHVVLMYSPIIFYQSGLLYSKTP